MRPNRAPTPAEGETDMFRNRLDNMIDMRHEWVRLAELIDWKRIDQAFGSHLTSLAPRIVRCTATRVASW
jgi:hypothetical protein